MKHGWGQDAAETRYTAWVTGQIETNPELSACAVLTDEWIVQRFVRLAHAGESEDQYEAWPGYASGMARSAALAALKECEDRWPAYEFRAHRLRLDEKLALEAIERARQTSS